MTYMLLFWITRQGTNDNIKIFVFHQSSYFKIDLFYFHGYFLYCYEAQQHNTNIIVYSLKSLIMLKIMSIIKNKMQAEMDLKTCKQKIYHDIW